MCGGGGSSLRYALCRSLSLSPVVWGPYPTGSRAVGFPGPRQRSGPVTSVLAAYSQCCQLGTVVSWCVVRASVRFTPQALLKLRQCKGQAGWRAAGSLSEGRRGTGARQYPTFPVPCLPQPRSVSPATSPRAPAWQRRPPIRPPPMPSPPCPMSSLLTSLPRSPGVWWHVSPAYTASACHHLMVPLSAWPHDSSILDLLCAFNTPPGLCGERPQRSLTGAFEAWSQASGGLWKSQGDHCTAPSFPRGFLTGSLVSPNLWSLLHSGTLSEGCYFLFHKGNMSKSEENHRASYSKRR